MKTCTRCEKKQKHDQFNRRARSSDGLQSWCKKCTNKQYRKTYPDNCKRIRKRNKQNRIDFCLWLDSLVTGPCADCGIDLGILPPTLGQWDHQPGTDKQFNIGDARKSAMSKKRILEELAKCELVCANCHSVRSTLRRTPEKIESWLASLENIASVPYRHVEGLDVSDLSLVITEPLRGRGPLVD